MTPDDKGTNSQEWIAKAEEDELSVNAILSGGGHASTACFLSQQMAEKSLKAALAFYAKPLRKVHDLLQLETELLQVLPEIKSLHDQLNLLNRYYIETRYPGDYPEFTITEAEQAFASAKAVKRFVLGNTSAG